MPVAELARIAVCRLGSAETTRIFAAPRLWLHWIADRLAGAGLSPRKRGLSSDRGFRWCSLVILARPPASRLELPSGVIDGLRQSQTRLAAWAAFRAWQFRPRFYLRVTLNRTI